MKNMNKLLKKAWRFIFSGFSFVFFGHLITKGISFISSAIAARMISKTQYAYFSYSDNLYHYLNLVAGAGIALALVKFCATTEDESKDKAFVTFSLKLSTIFNIAVTILGIIIVLFLEIPYKQAYAYIFLLALYPSMGYIVQVFQAYMRAKQLMKEYAISSVIQVTVILICSVLFIWAIGAYGIVLARYMAIFFAIFYGYKISSRKIGSVQTGILSADEKKSFLKMSIGLMIANFFSSVMPINETFLVNNLIRDTNVISNFKVAGMLPQQIIVLTNSICIYFFPIVAKSKNKDSALKTIFKAQVINMIIIGAACFVGMLSSKLFITMVYGKKYSDAVPVSYLLWTMRGINAGLRLVPMNMLPALGKVKFNSILAATSCVAHVIIDYFMIKNFGLSGVAYASIVIYLLTAALYWGYLIKVCKTQDKKYKKINV